LGILLIVAGALALVLPLIANRQRSNTTHREVVDRHDHADHRDCHYDDRGY